MILIVVLLAIALLIMIIRWCNGDYDATDILIRIGVILQILILILVIYRFGK